jgi:hypothetical protein
MNAAGSFIRRLLTGSHKGNSNFCSAVTTSCALDEFTKTFWTSRSGVVAAGSFLWTDMRSRDNIERAERFLLTEA